MQEPSLQQANLKHSNRYKQENLWFIKDGPVQAGVNFWASRFMNYMNS